MEDQTRTQLTRTTIEVPAYREIEGDQLYTVTHKSPTPRALALLVPPFPSERPFSYAPWVRWARYLATHEVTTLRFDYRGTGESTGAFADFTFQTWLQDAKHCANALRELNPDLPLLICGLGIGGIIASHLIKTHPARALVLWSTPESANDALKDILARRISFDYAQSPNATPKTWADYLRELDNGQTINVEGYPITAKLWHSSRSWQLQLPSAPGTSLRNVRLTQNEIPLTAGIGIWRDLIPAREFPTIHLTPTSLHSFKELYSGFGNSAKSALRSPVQNKKWPPPSLPPHCLRHPAPPPAARFK